ncbi:MAG: hypothetical protein GEU95_21475 [Rhizobiales bacterium]|nr:hypothetical protein [Hyphomicrobiales bacterium]
MALPEFLQQWKVSEMDDGKAFVLDHRGQVMFYVSREAAAEIIAARKAFLDAIVAHYDESSHNLRPRGQMRRE